MSEMTQRDAFISYNTADSAAVKRIVEGLKQRELSLFLDYLDLIPGRYLAMLHFHLRAFRLV